MGTAMHLIYEGTSPPHPEGGVSRLSLASVGDTIFPCTRASPRPPPSRPQRPAVAMRTGRGNAPLVRPFEKLARLILASLMPLSSTPCETSSSPPRVQVGPVRGSVLLQAQWTSGRSSALPCVAFGDARAVACPSRPRRYVKPWWPVSRPLRTGQGRSPRASLSLRGMIRTPSLTPA